MSSIFKVQFGFEADFTGSFAARLLLFVAMQPKTVLVHTTQHDHQHQLQKPQQQHLSKLKTIIDPKKNSYRTVRCTGDKQKERPLKNRTSQSQMNLEEDDEAAFQCRPGSNRISLRRVPNPEPTKRPWGRKLKF